LAASLQPFHESRFVAVTYAPRTADGLRVCELIAPLDRVAANPDMVAEEMESFRASTTARSLIAPERPITSTFACASHGARFETASILTLP
jgi:hypothetical protein